MKVPSLELSLQELPSLELPFEELPSLELPFQALLSLELPSRGQSRFKNARGSFSVNEIRNEVLDTVQWLFSEITSSYLKS